MRNFEQNKRRARILQSKPLLWLLGAAILAFAWNVFNFWTKLAETEKNKELAQGKAQELRQQKENLMADIEKLGTDRGKEEYFRENYGLAKEGEEVIIIVEDTTTPAPEKKGGIISWFKSWFK